MKKAIQIILILPLFCFAQNWLPSVPFPFNGVHHPITFSNDSVAYVVSGSYTNNVYKYVKSTNSWIQLVDFPGGNRGYSYGVTVNNKAYMGFGSDEFTNYYNDWWEFNMTTETWTQLSSLPGLGRNHPAMVATSDKIFMGCGSSDMGNFKDWWEYDIASNNWTQKPDLPSYTRHHPFYFGINDEVYVGFGHGSNPDSYGNYIYKDFWKYLPNNDQWIQLNDFPSEARVAGTQFSYNNKGYVLSGDGDDHQSLDSGEFWEYDPILDQWTQLPSHPGNSIWAPGCFVLGCDLYFLLGQDNNTTPGTLVTNTYTYKLSEDCGCMDTNAINFSSQAIYDDGSCCYVAGCSDPYAINFDSNVCFEDNSSCIYPILGCNNPIAFNYNPNANTTNCVGGIIDNNSSSGGYFYGDQHLLLDVYEECVIKSAIFEAEINNTITFELRDDNGNVIDDTTHTVIPGIQQLILNFDCPIGTNFQLGTSTNNTGLFRNNTGANYPYEVGGALSITESSAGASGYYYYYYNIEVEIPCVLPPSSWDCDGQGNCFDPGTGNGLYSSLSSCQSSCVVPSWDCDGQGNCFDPGTGNGLYSSLSSCQSSCVVPSWDCDGQGNCFDPGTGNGLYSSLSSCQSSCVVPSWDCDGQGNCFDPGTGNGLYSLLSVCELECTNTNILDHNKIKYKIYPNPSKDIFNLTFNTDDFDSVKIKVINILGETIYFETIENFDDILEKKIDLTGNIKGVYLLLITSDNVIINDRIILK